MNIGDQNTCLAFRHFRYFICTSSTIQYHIFRSIQRIEVGNNSKIMLVSTLYVGNIYYALDFL